ncbi:MAG: formylglycine-generating enzyme family protein [Planctomycetota bacterium]
MDSFTNRARRLGSTKEKTAGQRECSWVRGMVTEAAVALMSARMVVRPVWWCHASKLDQPRFRSVSEQGAARDGVSARDAAAADPAVGSRSKATTNSLGMNLVRIGPGSFRMGSPKGETKLSCDQWDERPMHEVIISKPFLVSATEVTNAQYEAFDSEHRKWRGLRGVSNEDNKAVTYVSWRDGAAFCEWLSEKEAIPYRLPTATRRYARPSQRYHSSCQNHLPVLGGGSSVHCR